MKVSSTFFLVCFAAIKNVTSAPVVYKREIDNSTPYTPGQKFNKKVGIPNDATEEEAPLADYFAFTEANVVASGVRPWYANWLNEMRIEIAKLAPGEEILGEWQMFITMFLFNRDLLCGPLIGSCDNMPSRDAILRLYHDSARAEARRVYFVTQFYLYGHHSNRLFQGIVEEARASELALVPYLIRDSTYQQDASDTERCEVETAMLMSTVSALLNTVSPIVGGFISPLQDAGGVLEWTTASFGPKNLNSKGNQFSANGLSPSINVANQLLDTWIQKLISKRMSENRGKPTIWNRLDRNFITAGYSSSPFCKGFSGDYPDLGLQNEVEFTKLLTNLFDDLVDITRTSFDSMYNGNFSAPSLTLQMMEVQNWDDIKARLDAAIDSRKKPMVESIFDYGLSEAAAQDRTFITCGLVPEGQRCQAPNKADPKYKPNGYRDTIICPLPERYNGRLMCSLAHLHQFEVDQKIPHEHVSDMKVEETPLLKGFEDLRVHTEYNYRIEQFALESFDNYLQHGNRPASLDISEWGTSVGKFHASVCVFPQGQQFDFTNIRKGNDNFLALCGDHTGDETVEFMEKMNMGIDSGHRNDAFREATVPRTFDIQNFTPVTWYTGLCRLRYKWPANRSGYWHNEHIREGADELCEYVLETLADKRYSMVEANDWFCRADEPPLKALFNQHKGTLYFLIMRGSKESVSGQCKKWNSKSDKEKDKIDQHWTADLGGAPGERLTKIKLPPSLKEEADELACGRKQLASGEISKEKFQECMDKAGWLYM